jgi:hypothetical protein
MMLSFTTFLLVWTFEVELLPRTLAVDNWMRPCVSVPSEEQAGANSRLSEKRVFSFLGFSTVGSSTLTAMALSLRDPRE